MKKNNALFFAFVSMIIIFVGCNRNAHITGRVIYADGQPVTTGQVIFTDDFRLGKSDIGENGEYSIHSFRRNDGIPKGKYKVYITSAFSFKETAPVRSETASYRMDTLVELIDAQYTNPDTSGWFFDIQKDSKIDLVVYLPGQVPEEQQTEAAKYMFNPEYRKMIDKNQGKPEPQGLSESTKPTRKRLVNPNLL